MQKTIITILGCGGSGGVPLITSNWGECNPSNPKNRRTRSSILIQTEDQNILIDTSPDLREQLLHAKVDRIDAVIYTHAHSDHINGLHELRQIALKHKIVIPIFGDEKTLDVLENVSQYAFEETDVRYPAFLKSHRINEEFKVGTLSIIPFQQQHGTISSLGFRIGDFAYSTDMKTLPQASIEVLRNLKLWIVDCLRVKPHATHSHLENTPELIKEIAPARSILTHMDHSTDFDALYSLLPESVEPAFDGMKIVL